MTITLRTSHADRQPSGVPDATVADQVVAEGIAKRVDQHSGPRGGWFEIRELMAAFGIERFSPEAQERMTAALSSARLHMEPPLAELDRSETVVLSLPMAAGSAEPPSDRQPLDELLTVRVAQPGETIAESALDDLAVDSAGEVRWFDIAESTRADPAEVLARLGTYCCEELSEHVVKDLLSPDPRPRIKTHGQSDLRCVSAFQVHACESDHGALPGNHSKAGILRFEPVEFLVGPDWLITCWHDVEIYRGADRVDEAPPKPPAQLFAEVARCWPRHRLRSAGDLATLVLHELALTYTPAYRQFYLWEEEWELDFFRRPDHIDRETLTEVRAAAAILRDWLSPLNPPGMRRDINKAWFPDITGSPQEGGYELALRIDDRIDHGLGGLRDFSATLRSAYDLLQLREREHERDRDDRFQRNIAIGGAVILIPTLVAGIMGANTWVPGQWREPHQPPHWAFAVLLGVVLISAGLAWVAIHWLQRRDATTDSRRQHPGS